jgi:DNA-binding CsgD family transcriptional regulator
VAEEVGRQGWEVVRGRAYPVETGAPYALLSDAFLPRLREMGEDRVRVLSRGRESDLRRLFPALGDASDLLPGGEAPRELQTRLYWSFTRFVQQWAQRSPVLLVLDDLHWGDASSLALLHFLVRHAEDGRVRVLATSNTDHRESAEHLLELERSVRSLEKLRLFPLEPLSREGTRELLGRIFPGPGLPMDEITDRLFEWTRGNAYFLEQVLESLVESGSLVCRDGVWVGGEPRELRLPPSVREAILARLRALPGESVRVAEVLAVVGSPAPASLLARVAGTDLDALGPAVDELVRAGLVVESGGRSRLFLDLRHPLAREALYGRLSRTRRRGLHRRVAEELEHLRAGAPGEHADELAYHFLQGARGTTDVRAARHLAAAGRAALSRHADREARDYLEAALDFLPGAGGAAGREKASDSNETPSALDPVRLRRELARAAARLGEYDRAEALWTEILEGAEQGGDPTDTARALRRLGLLAFWQGRHTQALELFARALEAVGPHAPDLRARLHISRGLALQELGRPHRGRQEVEEALALGERLDDPALLARVHRALALLHFFTGEAARARAHAGEAVELADRVGDDRGGFWARWTLASLRGLSGGPAAIGPVMAELRAHAERIRSPVLALWLVEMEVEHAYFNGAWDRTVARGEEGIARAAALNQTTLQVRLLVWTATCYLGRGELVRGEELVERAWALARVEAGGGTPSRDVHRVVPAYIGRTALHLARGEHEAGLRVGEEALARADEAGYVIWALHRLLPLVCELAIRAGRLDRAARAVERLRTEGARMEHRLALAWAAAGEAVICWHSGRTSEAADLLREAAEGLEEIGIVYEAARLRRQLAGRLAELHDPEGALDQLRRVHRAFDELGARPELEKARDQFREVGSRPPAPPGPEGAAALTPREREVAALVAAENSNKAVARELGISTRTVTTHLSNIYRKLGIGSRVELAERVREGRLVLG